MSPRSCGWCGQALSPALSASPLAGVPPGKGKCFPPGPPHRSWLGISCLCSGSWLLKLLFPELLLSFSVRLTLYTHRFIKYSQQCSEIGVTLSPISQMRMCVLGRVKPPAQVCTVSKWQGQAPAEPCLIAKPCSSQLRHLVSGPADAFRTNVSQDLGQATVFMRENGMVLGLAA